MIVPFDSERLSNLDAAAWNGSVVGKDLQERRRAGVRGEKSFASMLRLGMIGLSSL
jgi:hypothetical protein